MEENSLNNKCDLLLIGGSAGSLEILLKILPALNSHFTFAIVIILHRGSSNDSSLVELLSLKTNIPLREIEDKDTIIPGYIYIAPGDYHLLFEKNKLFALDASEKINYSRPSLDVTFESAAEIYGAHTIAILLSGANADGTIGLQAIKNASGRIIAQNPESAQVPFMPQNAIQHVHVDFIYNANEMVTFINSLE
jgi:two-component system chemotaxis response regulator CheB